MFNKNFSLDEARAEMVKKQLKGRGISDQRPRSGAFSMPKMPGIPWC